jgi:hypothetical protein
MLRLANIRNGLAYPHDDVCYFQSQYGHHARYGYFRIDAMPYKAVIHLLKGGTIEIIDATAKNKRMTDAQKFGIPTWCIVFNRALNFKGSRHIEVCDWQTDVMKRIALSSFHDQATYSIRKLVNVYGYKALAIIGKNIFLTCHSRIDFDDKPKRLKQLIGV